MTKLIRRLKPPKFTDHKDYKSYLRLEFSFSCVFCDLFETENGSEDNFEVEHYVPQVPRPPQKPFIMLRCIYENLLYSCSVCNGIKHRYWASKTQRERGQFYLNPTRHDIDEHIDRSQPKWVGITDTGVWNVRRLHLDSDTLSVIRSGRDQELHRLNARIDRIDRVLENLKNNVLRDNLVRVRDNYERIRLRYKRLDSRRK